MSRRRSPGSLSTRPSSLAASSPQWRLHPSAPFEASLPHKAPFPLLPSLPSMGGPFRVGISRARPSTLQPGALEKEAALTPAGQQQPSPSAATAAAAAARKGFRVPLAGASPAGHPVAAAAGAGDGTRQTTRRHVEAQEGGTTGRENAHYLVAPSGVAGGDAAAASLSMPPSPGVVYRVSERELLPEEGVTETTPLLPVRTLRRRPQEEGPLLGRAQRAALHSGEPSSSSSSTPMEEGREQRRLGESLDLSVEYVPSVPERPKRRAPPTRRSRPAAAAEQKGDVAAPTAQGRGPAWSEGEEEELRVAVRSLPPTTEGYWLRIAQIIGGGRTAQDCHHHYESMMETGLGQGGRRNQPGQGKEPAARKQPRKKSKQKAEVTGVTAGRGTMKRRRQVRELLARSGERRQQPDLIDLHGTSAGSISLLSSGLLSSQGSSSDEEDEGSEGHMTPPDVKLRRLAGTATSSLAEGEGEEEGPLLQSSPGLLRRPRRDALDSYVQDVERKRRKVKGKPLLPPLQDRATMGESRKQEAPAAAPRNQRKGASVAFASEVVRVQAAVKGSDGKGNKWLLRRRGEQERQTGDELAPSEEEEEEEEEEEDSEPDAYTLEFSVPP